MRAVLTRDARSVQTSAAGFSLIELTVSTAVLLIVSSIVTSALMQMTNSQATVWNRTEMHSGIRGATELLQQEVGQAGRIATAASVQLGSAVAAAASCDQTFPLVNAVVVGVNSVEGIFASAGPPAAYELLTTLDGDLQETVKIAAVNAAATPPTITACFTLAHAAGTVLVPLGGFANGIIPPTGVVNGSSATVLKMYGDINADGNMVYVEYTCDTGAHNLYRNVMPFNAGSKPALTNAQILLEQYHSESGRHTVLHVSDHEHDRAGHALHVRSGCRDHAYRADSADRPRDESLSDGNEGAPERVAAQHLQRVDAGEHWLYGSHSVHARDDYGVAALTCPWMNTI